MTTLCQMRSPAFFHILQAKQLQKCEKKWATAFYRVLSLNSSTFKGQLISKCLFEKIVWTKIPTKNLIDSAQQV